MKKTPRSGQPWQHNDGSLNMPKMTDRDREKNPNYRAPVVVEKPTKEKASV